MLPIRGRHYGCAIDPAGSLLIFEIVKRARFAWLLADAEMDDVKCRVNGIDFDPLDMRFGDHFYGTGTKRHNIKLGQSALTLSGGEAQPVKLAKELSRVAVGNTVYILDEPTTGLHFADIQRLLDVLQRLVDSGNTVIVVEHNLVVIGAADYIIDLGPEGGDEVGYIVAQRTPEQVAQESDSYTSQELAGLLRTSR